MKFNSLQELLYYGKYCAHCDKNICNFVLDANNISSKYNGVSTLFSLYSAKIKNSLIEIQLRSNEKIIFLDLNYIENKAYLISEEHLLIDAICLFISFGCINCSSRKEVRKTILSFNNNLEFKLPLEFKLNTETTYIYTDKSYKLSFDYISDKINVQDESIRGVFNHHLKSDFSSLLNISLFEKQRFLNRFKSILLLD